MDAVLIALALLPFGGALGAALIPRAARPLAAAALVVSLFLDGYGVLTSAPTGASLEVSAWVPALGLDPGLRLDVASGIALALVGIAGLAGIFRTGRAAPVAWFVAFVQSALLAGNALLFVALLELAVLAAFALEAGDPGASYDARAALTVRIAGALALLVAVLLFEDATGTFEFSGAVAADEAIRAAPLYPLVLALILGSAWSGPAAWPWIRRPARAAELTGVVFLVTGAYLAVRGWPLLAGVLPRAAIALGYVAVPLLVALTFRGIRAIAGVSPAPPVGSRGDAR